MVAAHPFVVWFNVHLPICRIPVEMKDHGQVITYIDWRKLNSRKKNYKMLKALNHFSSSDLEIWASLFITYHLSPFWYAEQRAIQQAYVMQFIR